MPLPVVPRFPADAPNEHVATIPACGALGIRVAPTRDGGIACVLGRHAATLDDGRVAAGAALTLADQATAQGVFGVLPVMTPMMTLALRIDWLGDLPGAGLTCTIEDVTREGALALVRGRFEADDGSVPGLVTARYLIGAMPGGDTGMARERPVAPPSDAADFAAYAPLEPAGDGWINHPRADHVGAPLPAYHGGIIAALLDGAAARTAPAGMVRADTDVRFLAPGRADRPLVLTARAVRAGRRVATIDAEARQDDGATLVATARCLFVAPALRT